MGGGGEGKTGAKAETKTKRENHPFTISNETCLLAPLRAAGAAAGFGLWPGRPVAPRPGRLLLPPNRSKVPSGLGAAL